MFHITCLARQLYETINGGTSFTAPTFSTLNQNLDYARLNPLSEHATIKFLSSLYLVHSVASLLLDRVDAVITSATNDRTPFLIDSNKNERGARAAAYGAIVGFTDLVLPFYRELEHRSATVEPRVRRRMQLLRTQAHELATLGARAFARAIRFLPPIHYAPEHARSVYAWAEFYAAEVDLGPDCARDLETCVCPLFLQLILT